MIRSSLSMIAGGCLLLVIMMSASGLPASSFCNSWQVMNPIPTGAHLYGVTAGADRWVAVGEQGTIVESPDRISWQLIAPLTELTLRSVAVNGTRFVAVGDGGQVLTSDQPGEWSSLGIVTGNDLFGVASGPSGFVAVGGSEAGGALFTSPDGLTWAAAEVDGARYGTLYAVSWTGALYVAVGEDETIITSPDAASWTRRAYAAGSGSAGVLTGVAGSSSLILATALGSVRYLSDDGLTWEEIFNKQLTGWPEPQDFPTGVVWCEPHFVKRFEYSSDGVTWISNDTKYRFATSLAFACGTDGELLAVGQGGHIAASDDHGAHFRLVNSIAAWNVMKTAWDGERIVAWAVSDQWQPQLLMSNDGGMSWQAAETSIEWEWVGLVAGANGFVSVDFNDEEWVSTIRTSSNGESWQQVWQGPGLAGITWDGSRYVVIGDHTELVGFSDNGSDWQLSQPGADRELTAVASNQELVVAVGGPSVVVTTDGSDWQETFRTVEDRRLHSVAWGSGSFVVVGEGGTILTSSDGVQWSTSDSGTEHDLLRVIRSEDAFIAVGRSGTIVASGDGAAWQLLDPGTVRDLNELSPNGNGVTVFGSYGLTLRSTCSDDLGEPPVAAFTAVPAAPPAGIPVHLADLSIGEPTAWQWDLGDGTTAQGRTTTHAYPAPGSYPVTLTVSNDNGSSTASRALKVTPPCGSPAIPQLQLPAEVTSGERYTVSWSDVGASEYRFQSSADPLFLRMLVADCDYYWSGTEARCTSDWQDHRSVFFRVRAIESCTDGSYYSDWSPVREVMVNRSLDHPGEHRQVIPAAAHTSGLSGTSWVTDMVIHNPQPTTVETALFLLHGSDTPDSLTELALRSGETVGLADVVQRLLPIAGETTGAILIDPEQPLVAGSRTFNDQPDGTYGQLIGAQPMSAAIVAGETGRLIGLQRSSAFRSNLGFANPGAEPITVTTELFSNSGAALSSRQDLVPARQHLQLTDLLGELGGGATEAYAVVGSADPDAVFFAYASVVDNQTGDSIAMVPVPAASDWRFSLTRPLPAAGTYSRMYAWYEVVFGGGWYLAHGSDRLATSRDGKSWQLQALDESVYGLGAGDEGLVAVGSQVIMSSVDGLDWQIQPWDGLLFDVVWTGDRWVAVGDGSIAVSSDGDVWTAHPAPLADLYSVVWTGERLVAGGDRMIATSSDGITWTTQSIAHRVGGLVWSGSVLLGLGDRLMRSIDGGDSWEVLGDSPTTAVWAGDMFVSHGPYGFMGSSDGLQWQELDGVPKQEGLYDLSWDGLRVISVLDRGYFFCLQAARPELVIPVAAHAGGANGTSWRTDLVLHNSGDTTVQAALELLEQRTDNSAPRSATLEVNGRSSQRLTDVLASLYGFNGVAGIRVTGSGEGLQLASRTYTDTGAGTYGQFIPAYRDGDAIWFYERGYMTQLASSTDTGSGFRTNIGLLSACAQPMDVEVVLTDANGTILGSPSYQLQPYELIQHNYIFSELSAADVSLATAEVSTPTVGCSFYAYASVIDNRSNDPVFIPASKLPVAPSQPDPRSLVLDNRTNAIVVDALDGARGSAQLPAGRLQATVSGSGNLGRADQLLRVACLYTNSRGKLRGASIGLGESVSDVAGEGPFWCIIPDWSSCQDNSGEAVVSLSGAGVNLSYRLDAADSCIALDELPETVSMPRSAQRYTVSASGDLGGAERSPQVLILFQTYYGRDMLSSHVVAAGEAISLSSSAITAKAVLLDLEDRADNSGVTELTPE